MPRALGIGAQRKRLDELWSRYHRAAAPSLDTAFDEQFVQRLSDRLAGYAEPDRQLTFGRNGIALDEVGQYVVNSRADEVRLGQPIG